MMYHPNHAESLVNARIAELRGQMAPRHSSRRAGRPRPVDEALRSIGWMLVGIGLRLAVPGRERRTLTTNA